MSGFILHTLAEADQGVAPLWPVSLAENGRRSEYTQGAWRLAMIRPRHGRGARFWECADGKVWIEGIPRPFPEGGSEWLDWLRRADGSFRGVFFPKTNGSPCAFTDPYGSRPVFYSTRNGVGLAADKVLSLSMIDSRLRDLNWPVMLEAMSMGHALCAETSIVDVVQLEACSFLAMADGQGRGKLCTYGPRPHEKHVCRCRTLVGDAIVLRSAVVNAITETCVDDAAALLLSGGCDSRWILRRAPHRCHTISVAPGDCREIEVARRVAKACGTPHRMWVSNPTKWLTMLREAHMLTAAMYEPLQMHFVEEGRAWANEGITTITHGMFFDTLLKGGLTFAENEFVTFDKDVYPQGAFLAAAHWLGVPYLRDTRQILSPLGRQTLAQRLRRFAEDTPPEQHDRFQFGYQRRVLNWISRHGYSVMGLNLMEHFIVESPAYHEALWQWWNESRPEHRKPMVAYLLAFLLDCGRVAWYPNGDSGSYAAMLLLRSLVGQAIPSVLRRTRRPLPEDMSRPISAPIRMKSATVGTDKGHPDRSHMRSAWGVDSIQEVLASQEGLTLIASAVSELVDEPYFDSEKLTVLLDGRIGSVDPRLVAYLTSLGLWKRTLRKLG